MRNNRIFDNILHKDEPILMLVRDMSWNICDSVPNWLGDSSNLTPIGDTGVR